jgi:hypothetical protein
MTVFRFGDFEADDSKFELRRGGQAVRVQRIVLETILFLIKGQGRAVSKSDLLRGPWRGHQVSDAAVSRAVMLARRALDDSSGRVLSTVHGVETLDRRLVFASLSLGAGPLDVFREVILPGAMPSIVTGLSIGMGTSWFSLVTAEMISGQFGIGYYTWEAYTLQKYPNIVLGMISIGILGMGSSFLIKAMGRRLMPWFTLGGGAT